MRPSLQRSQMRTLSARCMRMHVQYMSSSVLMLLLVLFRDPALFILIFPV